MHARGEAPGDSPERTKGPDAAPVVAPASDDPFLAAAASAAAAHKGSVTRILMLGRRWYDSFLYPTPGGRPGRFNKRDGRTSRRPPPTTDPNRRRTTATVRSSGDLPSSYCSPTGPCERLARTARRNSPPPPPPDGASPGSTAARATPRDSTNSENMQYTLPASHRGGPNQVRIAPQPAADTPPAATPPAADDELVPATTRSTVPATRPVRLARGPHPYPPAQNPQQVQHAWQSYQSMASQHAMSWMNAMWMNAIAATNAQRAGGGEQPGAKRKGCDVCQAVRLRRVRRRLGGSGGSGSGGSGAPRAAPGDLAGRAGRGHRASFPHKLAAGDKADFRLPSVSSDDTRAADPRGQGGAHEGPRSKRPNPNDKKAGGGAGEEEDGKGDVDAADCLQLLSEVQVRATCISVYYATHILLGQWGDRFQPL